MKKKNFPKRVAIALSGGVDSSVAAALLVKNGYDCVGFHMHLWHEPSFAESDSATEGSSLRFENKCCSTEALEAARKICQKLNIPFYPIDFSKVFKEEIVGEFLDCYGRGLTPNPCVTCNRKIKFGKLLEYVLGLGFDYLATGHYCRVAAELKVKSENLKVLNASQGNTHQVSPGTWSGEGIGERTGNCFRLITAMDQKKDQTYFLYGLTQEKLEHVLFPIGDYLKAEVREMARKWDLPSASKKDSMAICFFPEIDPRPFLKRQISEKIIPGGVVDISGKIIGRHLGLPLYTIGQRGGIGIDKKGFGGFIPPFYVVKKDVKNNRLVVGFGKDTERKEFFVEDVNWVNQGNWGDWGKTRNGENRVFVKIRSQGEMLPAEVEVGEKNVKIVLDEGQRGITPGQSCVIYREMQNDKVTKSQSRDRELCASEALSRCSSYEVIGGGVIS